MLANTSAGQGINININILDDQMFIIIMVWKALGTLLTMNSCGKAVIMLQEKCKSEIETESEIGIYILKSW